MHYPYCFTINRLSLRSHLGWQSAERSQRQPVALEVRLYFAAKPVCMSDDDADFLDYHGLCIALEEQVEQRQFRLIEYMSSELFAIARAYVDKGGYKDTKIWMRLTKSAAPVEHLQDGASFVMSDLPEGATFIAAA